MKPTHDAIVATVSTVIGNIIKDWGLDAELGPATRLNADLGFTSMDVIDLFATLEITFQRKMPYESFITAEGGGYRSELTIGELSDFIDRNFDVRRTEPSAI
jgi:acyl carrier protein